MTRRLRVAGLVTSLLISLSIVVTPRPAAATGPSITFTASFCEPIPPAQLPSACATSNGGPGQSYNIVLSWATNSDVFPPVYIWDTVGWEAQSGTKTIPVTQGGHYAYTLQMSYSGTTYFQKASVDVADLAAPTITSYSDDSSGNQIETSAFVNSSTNTYTDIKTGAQPKFNWTPGAPPAWAPGSTMYTAVEANPNILSQFPPASTATSYLIPNSDFQVTPTTYGAASYAVRSCVDTTKTPAFCSASVSVTAQLTGAQFQGGTRQFVPVGGNATVNWQNPAGQSTPGNFWEVVSPAIPNGGVVTTNHSYQVPTTQAGIEDVWLLTCDLTSFNPPAATCAGPSTSTNAPTAGTIQGLPSAGRYVLANADSGVTITSGSTVTHVTAPASGILDGASSLSNGSTVSQGETIFNTATQPGHQELVVGTSPGSSNATFQYLPWTSAFSQSSSHVYSTTDAPGLGRPTKTAMDSQGNVFFDGEFSTALGKLDPTKSPPLAVTSNEIPVAYSTTLNQQGYYPQTTPFAPTIPFSGLTSNNALGEATIYADGRIWTIQGGGFGQGGTTWNHSRIVSYDPTGGVLDHSIPGNLDSSYCAYSVPGNNNQIYDLAWDGQRIWFTEFGTGNISWFDPSQVQCDSMLNYTPPSNGSLIVPGSHSTCPTNTPNCFHSIPACSSTVTTNCLPEDPTVIKLATDPDPNHGGPNNHIWYTGFYGALGEITYDSSGNVTAVQHWDSTTSPAYPAPAPTSTNAAVWNVTADQQNVYTIETADLDLVKFNKATQTFNEIHLSGASSNAYLLTLGIFNGNLYFAIQDGWGSGSELGYVNIASWNAGSPTGTIYTGLSSFNAPNNAQLGGSAFDGLSFNSSTGAIALADYGRQQIYLLHP